MVACSTVTKGQFLVRLFRAKMHFKARNLYPSGIEKSGMNQKQAPPFQHPPNSDCHSDTAVHRADLSVLILPILNPNQSTLPPSLDAGF